MAKNNISESDACKRFISALKEDQDRTTDLVFDDMMKSKAFVMSQIPDGGVVDYNDNNDTIEYTSAMQAHRAYRSMDAKPKDLVAGAMPGRDDNGKTGLFDTQVNEVDPNACSGSCTFNFGQGFKTYSTQDYELPMTTDVVCARDYIRMGEAHVKGYFKGLTKSFREYGRENFEANLMNLVIANGGANASVLGANEFKVTTGGFVAPPQNRLSIHFLRQYRRYMIREGGLDELGLLEISLPREDWFDAVAEDQVRRNGMNGQAQFNTETFDDKRGKLLGREYSVYDGIRCVFDELPVRGYYKPTGTNAAGETLHNFVRIYHWVNKVNESGGLSAEPNHAYDEPTITVDGVTYKVITLAFCINEKSFRRYGLGAAKKYEGSKPVGQSFDMVVRDGSFIDCNDYDDKFRIVSRHAFRFKVLKAELSGAIGYCSSRPEGYILAPTGLDNSEPAKSFASPEEYEKCAAGTCDKRNCECDGKVANDNGDCVDAGTKGKVNLEPAVRADVVVFNEDVSIEIEVARSGSSIGAGTVDYAFTDIDGANGTDFVGTGGTITFADGETGSKAIAAIIKKVTPLIVSPNGLFKIVLSNATGTIELGTALEVTVHVTDGNA